MLREDPMPSARTYLSRVRATVGGSRPRGATADFWLLWSGQLVSRTGSAMCVVAIPLLAVTVLHVSPFEMGLLAAVPSLPTVLLSLTGGVLADRASKRAIMLAAEAGRAGILLTLGVVAVTGQLTTALLAALMFSGAVLGVFFEVSCTSLVPALVDRDRLLRANTAIQGARTASSLVGRSLGGLVVAALSAPVAIFLDALSYAVSFVTIWAMRWREPPRTDDQPRRSIRGDVVEGLRFARTHPYIRVLLGYAVAANFSISALFGVYVLHLSARLDLTPTQIGVVMTMLAGGSLVGTVVTPRLTSQFGCGPTVGAAGLIASASAWLLVVDSGPGARTFATQLVGITVLGAGLTTISVNINTLLQAVTPPRLMARIVGVTQFVCSLSLPVGAVLSGAVGEHAGTRASLVLVAATLMATASAFYLSTVSRIKPMPVLDEAAAQG